MYYECHVTIEHVLDEKRVLAKKIAETQGFKLAELLMTNFEESRKDTFMTSHSEPDMLSMRALEVRMCKLVQNMQEAGFKVFRYKIEHVVIDSRNDDRYKLLKEISNET
jgi:hypothetical protein